MIDDDQDSPTPPARSRSELVQPQLYSHYQRGMDIEGHVAPVGTTPISSPKPRSSGSASADTSTNSVGSSSLDTASASAHLERYEVPWGIVDLSVHRQRLPRRTRSYNAFLEWEAAGPIARSAVKHARPLAGASRRRLIKQIQQLTKDKAEIQAQLAAISSSSSSSTNPGIRMAGIGANDGSGTLPNAAPPLITISPSRSGQADRMDGNVSDGDKLDGIATREAESILPSMSLELIASLTDRLVAALDTSTIALLDETDRALLERPGMRALLLRSSQADPQRDSIYAEIFARRFVEVQKRPELRSRALRPGPLQSTVKHPEYVDVLMKGLREAFIAHSGAFDDTELGLWILNGIQFHSEALGDVNLETAEFDDDFFEIPAEMFARFPFTGTKEMIATTNRWRAIRGESLLQQTPEMAAAEEYTKSRQIRAQESTSASTSQAS